MKIKSAKKNSLVVLDGLCYLQCKRCSRDVGLACKESVMLFFFMRVVFVVLRLETNRNYIRQCGNPLTFHKKKLYLQCKAFDIEGFLKSFLSLIFGGVSLLFGVSVGISV